MKTIGRMLIPCLEHMPPSSKYSSCHTKNKTVLEVVTYSAKVGHTRQSMYCLFQSCHIRWRSNKSIFFLEIQIFWLGTLSKTRHLFLGLYNKYQKTFYSQMIQSQLDSCSKFIYKCNHLQHYIELADELSETREITLIKCIQKLTLFIQSLLSS